MLFQIVPVAVVPLQDLCVAIPACIYDHIFTGKQRSSRLHALRGVLDVLEHFDNSGRAHAVYILMVQLHALRDDVL